MCAQGWVWYHEEAKKIKLQFNVDNILHRNRWVKPFKRIIEEAYLPAAAVQDSLITIKIKVLKGTIAVLSGLEIHAEIIGSGIRIRLYDVSGRLVQEKNLAKSKIGMNEVLIRPEGLSAGVYFVQLETLGYNKTEKVILLK